MRAYVRWAMGPDGGMVMLTLIGSFQLLTCVLGKFV